MRKIIVPFIIIIPLIFVFSLSWSSSPTTQEVLVTKVIDGDTFLMEGGQSVRMLGMDTDERGYPCYTEAKEVLEEKILNRRVILETDKEDKDKYGRLLRWVWFDDNLINLEMVEEGLAVARFEQDAKYQDEIRSAEHEAIENRIGCKWSSLE